MTDIKENQLILDYVYDHEAHLPDKVLFTQPVGGGQVRDYTWAQTLDESRRMAAHLKSLGLPRGARIAMLAKNSAHFIMAELAIWMAGGTTVAIFPTESAENVRFVLEHSEASLLFIGKLDTWEQQKTAVPADLPCITLPLAPAIEAQAGFEAWDAIVARTEPIGGRPYRSADDLAMLLYTSGSTGQPKGVMQSFGTITRASEGIVKDQQAIQSAENGTRVLSYLPLAHTFERAWIECLALMSGQTHVYFSESLATFMDDIKRARPTAFISVPRLWTKFQHAVHAHMPAAQLDAMLDNPVMAKAVGQKVLASLGLGEVLRAGSGSAPLPVEVLQWYLRLGLNLVEGYGMTEDFAYSHISGEGGSAPGYVGVPYPGVQVRLEDDGEILIKSPGQLVGYYKLPELSAESFTEDGFFRTGDLGERNSAGLLKLTGRKKELFKTAKGKYIAPSPIENRLNAHPMVELSMVSGVGQNFPYAMVMLDEALRPRLGDAAVRADVDTQLARLLHDVNAQLASHERLHMLVVAKKPWTIENGFLTPTMKIKRSRIEAAVAPQVVGWYGAVGPVIWA
ncbi:MAG: AMP-binding protein [Polaromonas sp.]|nr:AMP-binding protein [Polaromonas sp.]